MLVCLLQSVLQDDNSILMTTKDNEKYKCVLPVVEDDLSQVIMQV